MLARPPVRTWLLSLAMLFGCGSGAAHAPDGGGSAGSGGRTSAAGGSAAGGSTSGTPVASGGSAGQTVIGQGGAAGSYGNNDAGDAQSSQSGTLDSFEPICQAQLELLARCSGTSPSADPTYVSNCIKNGGNPSYYRADAFQMILTCYQTTQPCATPETCVHEAMAALNPQYQTDDGYSACAAKIAECQAPPYRMSLGIALCSATIITTDATRASLKPCFTGPCEELVACYNSALGKSTN
jgi:hypothetical protein